MCIRDRIYNNTSFENIFTSVIAKSHDQLRAHLFLTSLKVFVSNPLIGSGLGNWAIEVYKYNLDGVGGLDHPYLFYRVRSHNLYGLILAELGIIGFLSYLTPLLYSIQSIVRTYWSLLLGVKKASITAIIVYLVLSFFYASVNFAPYHFSEISLVVFSCMGIVTRREH